MGTSLVLYETICRTDSSGCGKYIVVSVDYGSHPITTSITGSDGQKRYHALLWPTL